jgi:hypothetical protein
VAVAVGSTDANRDHRRERSPGDPLDHRNQAVTSKRPTPEVTQSRVTRRHPMATQPAECERRKGEDRQRRLAGLETAVRTETVTQTDTKRALPHSRGKDGMEADAVT